MKKIIFSAVFLLATISSAQALKGPAKNLGADDVVAPTIWGTPSDLIQGMIYFDASASALKFVGDNATPVTIGSTSGSFVTSAGSSEKIQRARITCSSTASAIVSQSGTWLSSVTNGGVVGTCTVNFPGVFSAEPACHLQVVNAAITNFSGGTVTAASATAVNLQRYVNGANGNGDFYLTCMGPG